MKRNLVIISDVHLGSYDSKGVYGSSPSEDLKKDIGTDKLELLKGALLKRYQNKKIDLLIFLGDYITGHDNPSSKSESFDVFLDFLAEIEGMSDLFRNPDHIREHIIIVPGNHDVERGTNQPLKKFQHIFNSYITPFRTKSGKGVCQLGAPIFVYDKEKLLVACISTVNHASTETDRIPQLLETAKKNKGVNEKWDDLIKYLEEQQIKDIPAVDSKAVKEFNQLSASLPKKYADYKKIVVSHHPMISGLERDKTIKEYPSTIGGRLFQSLAANKGYSYFLNGHIHDFVCAELLDHTQPLVRSIHISAPDFILDRDESELKIVELTLTDDGDDEIRLLKASSYYWEFKEERLITPGMLKHGEAGTQSILVDSEIEQLIKEGIVIQNADSSRIEAASYDCALGTDYKRASDGSYRWKDDVLTPGSGDAAKIILAPGETILIYTEEKFSIPSDMVLHASPISTWARKGLRVEISYFVDPGFQGPFCFPVTNVSTHELSISSTDPIMSVEFVQLSKHANAPWYSRHPDKLDTRAKKRDH